MRKLLVILSLSSLFGCSSFRAAIKPFAPSFFQDSTPPVVTPTFLLAGKAAKAQDSLHDRLQWLAGQTLPKDYALGQVAFGLQNDSSLVLHLRFQDGQRVNSHGLTPEQTREKIQKRLRTNAPLVSKAREAGIRTTIRLQASFRSRDFLFQNARWTDDSASWIAEDSSAP